MSEIDPIKIQPIDPIRIASELLAKSHQPDNDRIEVLLSEAVRMVLSDTAAVEREYKDFQCMALAEIAVSLRVLALMQVGMFHIHRAQPAIVAAKKVGPHGLN